MLEIETGNHSQVFRGIVHEYLNSVLPFIEGYEKKEMAVESSNPEEILRFLMEQNHLSQYDIAAEVGGQPVVSDILRGKRKLTRDHIEKLSKRFGVSSATFFAN